LWIEQNITNLRRKFWQWLTAKKEGDIMQDYEILDLVEQTLNIALSAYALTKVCRKGTVWISNSTASSTASSTSGSST